MREDGRSEVLRSERRGGGGGDMDRVRKEERRSTCIWRKDGKFKENGGTEANDKGIIIHELLFPDLSFRFH